MTKIAILLILIMNSITTMNAQKFESEYGYSIVLPNNWSEYELEDEENTNGFFDTSEWTGNLRITPLRINVDNPYEFIKNQLKAITSKEINWDNIKGLNYSEESDDLYSYYWYLIENDRIYICSFTVESENKQSDQNRKQVNKIETILKTLKSN